MVRPKASDTNKAIARIFADTLTVKVSDAQNQKSWFQKSSIAVDCRGPKSIYQALKLCLPKIVREIKDQVITNRKGIAEVELNKLLTSSGYLSSRRRLWNSDSKVRWHREWCDRRWINLTSPEDLLHVQRQLCKIHQYPEARALTVDHIRACLHEICENGNMKDMLPPSGMDCGDSDDDDDDNDGTGNESSASQDGESRRSKRHRSAHRRGSIRAPKVEPGAEPTTMDMDSSDARYPHVRRLPAPHSVAETLAFFGADPAARRRSQWPPQLPTPFGLSPTGGIGAWAAGAGSARALGGEEATPRLLRLAEEGGWDFLELRRLLTHGYCPDTVWGLLTALPADLRALLRSALRAAQPPDRAAGAGSGHGGGGDGAGGGGGGGGGGVSARDGGWNPFAIVDAEARTALEADWDPGGGSGGLGYFEAEYDAATQRRCAVRLSERYAAVMYGGGGGVGSGRRARLLVRFARHEVPLPAPELDFLATALDDLLRRRGDGEAVRYIRVVRPAGCPACADAGGGGGCGCAERPPEAALVCVLSRARFDAEGRIVRVSELAAPHAHAPVGHPLEPPFMEGTCGTCSVSPPDRTALCGRPVNDPAHLPVGRCRAIGRFGNL
jgi:hypothetical protein